MGWWRPPHHRFCRAGVVVTWFYSLFVITTQDITLKALYFQSTNPSFPPRYLKIFKLSSIWDKNNNTYQQKASLTRFFIWITQLNHLPTVIVLVFLDLQPVLSHDLQHLIHKLFLGLGAASQGRTQQSKTLLKVILEIICLGLSHRHRLRYLFTNFFSLLVFAILGDEFSKGVWSYHAYGI